MRFHFIAGVGLITILLAIPRFGHETPDSHHYVQLGQYFQGDFPREKLTTPFVYRLLLPALAAAGPTKSVPTNMAVLNVLFTISAYWIFFYWLRHLPLTVRETRVGMLLLAVSFPSMNYASAVLTDATGFFFVVASAYCLVREKWGWFSFVACLGVLARDATLVLEMALLLMAGIRFLTTRAFWKSCGLAFLAVPPILVYAAVRLYYYDLPQYVWTFSRERLIGNIRVDTALTFSLTLFPPLALILLGWFLRKQRLPALKTWFSSHEKVLFVSISLACGVLILYSILTACLSGRFIWPAYLVLIPAAARGASYHRRLFDLLNGVVDRLFGEEREPDVIASAR